METNLIEKFKNLLKEDFLLEDHIKNYMHDGDFEQKYNTLSANIVEVDSHLQAMINDNLSTIIDRYSTLNATLPLLDEMANKIKDVKLFQNKLTDTLVKPYINLDSDLDELKNDINMSFLTKSYEKIKDIDVAISKRIGTPNDLELVNTAEMFEEFDGLIKSDSNILQIDGVTAIIESMTNYKLSFNAYAKNVLEESFVTQNQLNTSLSLQALSLLNGSHFFPQFLDETIYHKFEDALNKCFEIKDIIVSAPGDKEMVAGKKGKRFAGTSASTSSLSSEYQNELKMIFWKNWSELLNTYCYSHVMRLLHLQSIFLRNFEQKNFTNQNSPLQNIFLMHNKNNNAGNNENSKKIFQDNESLTPLSFIKSSFDRLNQIMQRALDERFPPNTNINSNLTESSRNITLNKKQHHAHVSLLKQTCENEYPRLLKAHDELIKNIEDSALFHSVNTLSMSHSYALSSVLTDNEFGLENDLFTDIVQPLLYDPFAMQKSPLTLALRDLFTEPITHAFEKGYLLKNLSRIFDPINVLFSSKTSSSNLSKSNPIANSSSNPQIVFKPSDMENIIKIMTKELLAVKFRPTLQSQVAQNVINALKMILVKCEEAIDNTPNAFKVSTLPNTSQKYNANIAKCLYYLHFYVEDRIHPIFDQLNVSSLSTALGTFYSQLAKLMCSGLLDPLFSSLELTYQNILSACLSHELSDLCEQRCQTVINGGTLFTSIYHTSNDTRHTMRALKSSNYTSIPASPYMKEFVTFNKAWVKGFIEPLFGRKLDFGLSNTLQTLFLPKSTGTGVKSEANTDNNNDDQIDEKNINLRPSNLYDFEIFKQRYKPATFYSCVTTSLIDNGIMPSMISYLFMISCSLSHDIIRVIHNNEKSNPENQSNCQSSDTTKLNINLAVYFASICTDLQTFMSVIQNILHAQLTLCSNDSRLYRYVALLKHLSSCKANINNSNNLYIINLLSIKDNTKMNNNSKLKYVSINEIALFSLQWMFQTVYQTVTNLLDFSNSTSAIESVDLCAELFPMLESKINELLTAIKTNSKKNDKVYTLVTNFLLLPLIHFVMTCFEITDNVITHKIQSRNAVKLVLPWEHLGYENMLGYWKYWLKPKIFPLFSYHKQALYDDDIMNDDTVHSQNLNDSLESENIKTENHISALDELCQKGLKDIHTMLEVILEKYTESVAMLNLEQYNQLYPLLKRMINSLSQNSLHISAQNL